jgi:hypothetical protein
VDYVGSETARLIANCDMLGLLAIGQGNKIWVLPTNELNEFIASNATACPHLGTITFRCEPLLEHLAFLADGKFIAAGAGSKILLVSVDKVLEN